MSSQPTNQRVHLLTEVPGKKSRELRAREDLHIAPGLQSYAITSGVVVDHARGSAITDVDGNVLLDLIGGIGVNGFGHSHPASTACSSIRPAPRRWRARFASPSPAPASGRR